jgi:CheY-like chemotaxis protein
MRRQMQSVVAYHPLNLALSYTALRRMRAIEEARGVAAPQRIPAIALTALAGAEERLRALSAGFQ